MSTPVPFPKSHDMLDSKPVTRLEIAGTILGDSAHPARTGMSCLELGAYHDIII